MRASLTIITLVGLVVLLVVVEGRYYKKINNDYVAYDWVRSKRQSHPDSTIAQIPQIAFADPVNNEALPGGVRQNDVDRQGNVLPSLPVPAEYLTPPAPDSAFQLTPQQPPPPTDKWHLGSQLAQLPVPPQPLPQPAPQPQQTDKWNLEYEAGDVLVPPPSDPSAKYDTMRLFTLVPQSNQPEGHDGFGPAEQDSAADSRTPFIDSYHPQWQPPTGDSEESPSNKPPVYTFVKTDPHGHFKWGVHIGH